MSACGEADCGNFFGVNAKFGSVFADITECPFRILERLFKAVIRTSFAYTVAQNKGVIALKRKKHWSRFSNSADKETKERVLAEQRNWIAMKEEVIMTAIGSGEQNGSIYPLLENSFLEEITKNRAYILANELAEVNGESFVMPEQSDNYGVYIENQGTGSVYSSMLIRQDLEGNDEAIISIFRLGEATGSFVDNGNGELTFTSYDESVKGIIKMNGWNGASFKVTETAAESIFTVDEEFEFPFVF